MDVVEQVRHRHRRDLDRPHRAAEAVRVTGDEFGVECHAELVERRLAQCRFFGDRPHGVVEIDTGQRVVEWFELARFDAVDDDRGDGVVAERVAPDDDPFDDLGGAAVVSVDDGNDRQSEVFCDPSVHLQFDRRRGPGEVGALDDDEVAGRFDLLEPLDDPVHAGTVRRADIGAFRSGEGVADALVGHLVARADQVEVVVGKRLDDGAVEADARHAPRQQFDQPERHDRLPTRRPHRRDVDRCCHEFDCSRAMFGGFPPRTVSDLADRRGRGGLSTAPLGDLNVSCSGRPSLQQKIV